MASPWLLIVLLISLQLFLDGCKGKTEMAIPWHEGATDIHINWFAAPPSTTFTNAVTNTEVAQSAFQANTSVVYKHKNISDIH